MINMRHGDSEIKKPNRLNFGKLKITTEKKYKELKIKIKIKKRNKTLMSLSTTL